METVRPTFRRDLRYIAAAALAAVIALEVEAASRATFDAVQTSAAIACRVVSTPVQARAAAGVSLSLTAAAICLILLARVSFRQTRIEPARLGLRRQANIESIACWRNQRIRAARLGGALDR